MITLEQLVDEVWSAVYILRDNVNIIDYKNYLLRLLLLKRLSDLFEEKNEKIKQKAGSQDLSLNSLNKPRFFIPKGARWSDLQSLEKNIGAGLDEALTVLEIANPELRGIFTDTDNWRQVSDELLLKLIQHFSTLNLQNSNLVEPNLLGYACEDLIEKFALSEAKTNGVSTTPRQVAKLMVRLIEPREEMHICDPVCGTGSLLVEYANQTENYKDSSRNMLLYGQALNKESWIITRINLLLHDIFDFDIRLGDTLNDPELLQDGELMRFDRVVANPPFSIRNWGRDGIINLDKRRYNRFYYGTPPKNNSDYAFIQHILASLKETGRAVVLVSHGTLFRRGAEAQIREGIIRDDLIEAVIGLAPKLFFTTSVPGVILVLNKDKEKDRRKRILLVDASHEYQADKSQNHLRDEDLKHIISVYHNFQDEEGYAKVVSCEELAADDYTLNIERYVTSPKLKVDLEAEISKLSKLKAERTRVESEMNEYLQALGIKI
ncbi:type I restriction-modification system subunit M [Trichocoleus sp. ST-U3]|uniref:HsdM family class I SAM-dependent methyltransferase n=1 Tax=Coleofasciculus sp. FACHB-542 TaxID=2692787 RepID=UPI0016855F0B|nr:class I SAM-dependent DNA methyltransferase [Coleofasciculus sp. FACHB-542]MBD2083452.1 SAM-dependent DNA methyltransferase [Coleofasciculus sp. FACHB-542]